VTAPKRLEEMLKSRAAPALRELGLRGSGHPDVSGAVRLLAALG
jgi:hypothetical protein